ncbi:MAG: PqqD family protein [Limisphaerales bacterium]|nr:hypothetical protein [Verrucomicrobiales bacterium]|tara:strand:+ start:1239 stop:1559 length:321 start_codon:yes stop_codon:yes gene_type:complete
MATPPIDFYSSEALQFKFSNKIMFRELDEESVLLNLNDESYYALNATGTFLWKELVRNQSLANAFVSFKKHYQVETEQAKLDFTELVQRLIDKKFGEIESMAVSGG